MNVEELHAELAGAAASSCELWVWASCDTCMCLQVLSCTQLRYLSLSGFSGLESQSAFEGLCNLTVPTL